MSQDFDMANCVRLWDTLFSDTIRFDYLNYVSVAIIQQVRDEVLDGDFAVCMESLQSQTRRNTDIQILLNHAAEVKQFYDEKRLYERLLKEKADKEARATKNNRRW